MDATVRLFADLTPSQTAAVLSRLSTPQLVQLRARALRERSANPALAAVGELGFLDNLIGAISGILGRVGTVAQALGPAVSPLISLIPGIGPTAAGLITAAGSWAPPGFNVPVMPPQGPANPADQQGGMSPALMLAIGAVLILALSRR